MNRDIIIIICSVISIVLIVVPLGLWWEVKRSTTIVRQWAESNNLLLSSTEFRWVKRGPYSGWATSTQQAVHRIVVTDAQGRQMSGWLQCKNLYGKGDKIEVKWDETPTTT